MFYIFDFLVYIIYVAYKNSKFETFELQATQSRIISGLGISALTGMYINYWLVDHWHFYRKLFNDYQVFAAIISFVYAAVIFILYTRRYKEGKILDIVAKQTIKIAVSFARFIMIVYILFCIFMSIEFFIATLHASNK